MAKAAFHVIWRYLTYLPMVLSTYLGTGYYLAILLVRVFESVLTRRELLVFRISNTRE